MIKAGSKARSAYRYKTNREIPDKIRKSDAASIPHLDPAGLLDTVLAMHTE